MSIGGPALVPQSMCNTHTSDVEATVKQCMELAEAGSALVRITVPGPKEVEDVKEIKRRLREAGCNVPLVADIHFSSETAIAVAPVVEKVRINPGNFHRDHAEACRQFSRLVKVCRESGTAIRIGLNHGSLGERITSLYGNTPLAMAEAAMEWIRLAVDNDFFDIVVSLKASNTVVMVEAYRTLSVKMKEYGHVFPLHVGVTEAGNGDSGRIKSCVGISTLLSEGIGDTVRVSLTEDPVAEIPVADYLCKRYSPGGASLSSLAAVKVDGRKVSATYHAPSRERLLMELCCDFGKRLLEGEIDDISFDGDYIGADGNSVDIDKAFSDYLADELLQACRRRFYRPEYIACPGCGRTMYDLQGAFEAVKKRTAHLKNIVIAVLGCVVNGPGEMADADWGYVGEGNNKVSIYHGRTPVLRHVPDTEAVDRLVELIEESNAADN